MNTDCENVLALVTALADALGFDVEKKVTYRCANPHTVGPSSSVEQHKYTITRREKTSEM